MLKAAHSCEPIKFASCLCIWNCQQLENL